MGMGAVLHWSEVADAQCEQLHVVSLILTVVLVLLVAKFSPQTVPHLLPVRGRFAHAFDTTGASNEKAWSLVAHTLYLSEYTSPKTACDMVV